MFLVAVTHRKMVIKIERVNGVFVFFCFFLSDFNTSFNIMAEKIGWELTRVTGRRGNV